MAFLGRGLERAGSGRGVGCFSAFAMLGSLFPDLCLTCALGGESRVLTTGAC